MSDASTDYTGHLVEVFARVTAVALTADVLRSVGEAGVTPALLGALECLRRAGTGGVAYLARGLGVSYAAASQFVRRLETKGLVVRDRDERDRRRSPLRLSAAGERLVDAAAKARAERLDDILANVGPEERAALVRGMEALLLQLLDDPEAIGQLCSRCWIRHMPECVVNRASIANTGREAQGRTDSE